MSVIDLHPMDDSDLLEIMLQRNADLYNLWAPSGIVLQGLVMHSCGGVSLSP